MLNAPAEDEVFVNVEALTKKIAALENEVKGLEEELARLKSQQQ
jgi:hypothetical protein